MSGQITIVEAEKVVDVGDLGPDDTHLPGVFVKRVVALTKEIGVDNVAGQLTAWNYYQTLQTPTNTNFVTAFKNEYGVDRVTSDPMEAAYTSLYLWKGMVEKANSFEVPAVRDAAGEVTFDAPEGTVTVNGDNHHHRFAAAPTRTPRLGLRAPGPAVVH